MAQNPENQRAGCRKCWVAPGAPCVTNGGQVALRVHFGRAGRSAAPAPRPRRAAPRFTPAPQQDTGYAAEHREMERRRYGD